MVNWVEEILETVDNQPERRPRAIASDQGADHMTAWHVWYEECLQHYYLQRVQALNETDFPQRVTSSYWFLRHCILQPQFATSADVRKKRQESSNVFAIQSVAGVAFVLQLVVALENLL
ncbi:hypothetical protein AVEN_152943-1 [Araneus ventricosus]|uniref:Uncharacterized protein n=1 Tax=Araneus ventricosus TaxID=182803 RepID=A0A4Y2AES8_ARAVE|nr:hypothetical protein AVEN_152943-1 [Araneus ventricosus]